jgi:basic membrane protein A and related proteins
VIARDSHSTPRSAIHTRLVLAATAVGALALAACSSSSGATPAGGSSPAGGGSTQNSNFSACLIISATGVADHSFNQAAWSGLTEAKNKLGITIKYLAQSGSTDYSTLGAQFVQEGCSMIIGMGFNTQTTINTLAPQNPNIKFALIDSTLSTKASNAVSLTYQTDQAGFLGGYLAAGLSKSGTVGVYGNEPIPPVQLYMTGYVYGVQYYNKVHGKNVKVIGWDPAKKTGQFVGSFTDVNKGKLITQAELQQGADVIFPVAGPIDAGTATAIRAAGGPKAGHFMLWVDSDGCQSNPDACDVIVSTVQKNIQPTLFDVVSKTVSGKFPSGSYVGTLANHGVGLAPYHKLTSDVSSSLQSEVAQLTKDVASGKVKVAPTA